MVLVLKEVAPGGGFEDGVPGGPTGGGTGYDAATCISMMCDPKVHSTNVDSRRLG